MAEQDTKILLREILDAVKAPSSICGADINTMKDHSNRLTTVELKVDYINQDTKEIKEMLKTAISDGSLTKDRVLKIETEKRTWIAVVVSVVVAGWELVKTFCKI